MYCWKCGKKIQEEVKFCSACGAKIAASESIKGTLKEFPDYLTILRKNFPLILVIVMTLFEGACGIYKVIYLDIWLYDKSVNIFQLWEILDKLELAESPIFIAITLCVLSAASAVKFLIDLFKGKKGKDLIGWSKSCMFFGAGYILMTALYVSGLNGSLEMELGAELDVLSIAQEGWLLLIAPFFHLIFCIKLYIKTTDKEENIVWKRCTLCKTEYQGDNCPKCGSSLYNK